MLTGMPNSARCSSTFLSSAMYLATLISVHSTRDATRHQFIIDLLDVWIPATNLGYTRLNDGFLGIFGSVIFCLLVVLILTFPFDQPYYLSHGLPPAMVGCQQKVAWLVLSVPRGPMM